MNKRMELPKPDRAIVVVGSANMDMVVSCEHFPRPGETVLGGSFGMYPGGKGANQAVAAAKLGGHVRLLAKMGQDAFQEKLCDSLKKDGVQLEYVITDPDAPTGIALIAVNSEGENEIIVVSGSNMKLTPKEVEASGGLFEGAGVVLLQLEIPLDAVNTAVTLGRSHGATIILNPAPARNLPAELLARVDILTPNATEAEMLTGVRVHDERSAREAGHRLLEQGVGKVIVTRGDQGALLVTKEQSVSVPAHRVQPVDTTAAGDAFNGALSYAMAGGVNLTEAIEIAGTAAAYAVTKMGAQTSMPTAAELKAFAERLARNNADHTVPQ